MKNDEEKIEFSTEGISQVSLSAEPLGENRQDRGVNVEDASGKTMRTSSIMMGYNKANIVLENGEYVNAAEIEQALAEAITKQAEKRKIICKKTGKEVSVSEMVEIILEAARARGIVTLGEKSSKITNQNTATVAITGKGQQESITKGVLMLGNQGLAMPCGEYVKVDEITIALGEYMTPIPPAPPVIPPIKPPVPPVPPVITDPPTPTPQQPKKEIYKVTKIDKIKLSMLPLIMAAIISLFGNIIQPPTDIIIPDQVLNSTILNYEANEIIEKKVLETIEEAIKRAYSGINIGAFIHTYPGLQFHESSDWEFGGANGMNVFGSDIRPDGNYVIEYISIIYNGQIIKVTMKAGDNLYDVLKAVADQYGVSITDLEAKIHLTGPVAGWVDVNELLKDVLNRQVKTETTKSESIYKGTLNNYSGGTITFMTPDGPVTIVIKDKYGNFIDDGTTVIGTDGNSYEVRLELKEVQTVIEGETKTTGWDINWECNSAPLLTLSAIALAAFLTALTARRRSQEFITGQAAPIRDHEGSIFTEGNEQKVMGENTQVHTEGLDVVVSGRDVIERSNEKAILLALDEAKKNYDKKSGFVKFMNKLRHNVPKWNDILQDLNNGKIKPDDVANMFK